MSANDIEEVKKTLSLQPENQRSVVTLHYMALLFYVVLLDCYMIYCPTNAHMPMVNWCVLIKDIKISQKFKRIQS